MPPTSTSRSCDYLNGILFEKEEDIRQAMQMWMELDASINTVFDAVETDYTASSILADDAQFCGNKNCKPAENFPRILPALNQNFELPGSEQFPRPSRDVVYTNETEIAADYLFPLDKENLTRVRNYISRIIRLSQNPPSEIMVLTDIKDFLRQQSEIEKNSIVVRSEQDYIDLDGKTTWGPMKLMAFALHYCIRPILNILTFALEKYDVTELNLFSGDSEIETEKNQFIVVFLSGINRYIELDDEYLPEVSKQVFQLILKLLVQLPDAVQKCVESAKKQDLVINLTQYNTEYNKLIAKTHNITAPLFEFMKNDEIEDINFSVTGNVVDTFLGMSALEAGQFLVKNITEIYFTMEKKSIGEAFMKLFKISGESLTNYINSLNSQNNVNQDFYSVKSFTTTFQPFDLRAIFTVMEYFIHLYNFNCNDQKALCVAKNHIVSLFKKYKLFQFLKKRCNESLHASSVQLIDANVQLIMDAFNFLFDQLQMQGKANIDLLEGICQSEDFKQQIIKLANTINLVDQTEYEAQCTFAVIRCSLISEYSNRVNQLVIERVVELQDSWSVISLPQMENVTDLEKFYYGLGNDKQLHQVALLLNKNYDLTRFKNTKVSDGILMLSNEQIESVSFATTQPEDLKVVLVFVPQDSLYELKDYMIVNKQEKVYYTKVFTIHSDAVYMLINSDLPYPSFMDTKFTCTHLGDSICKHCELRDKGLQHMRTRNYPLLTKFDPEPFQAVKKNLCERFVLNLARLNAFVGPEFQLFQNEDGTVRSLSGNQTKLISSAGNGSFTRIIVNPKETKYQIKPEQIDTFLEFFIKINKVKTAHCAFNEKKTQNLDTLIVMDLPAIKGLEKTGNQNIFVQKSDEIKADLVQALVKAVDMPQTYYIALKKILQKQTCTFDALLKLVDNYSTLEGDRTEIKTLKKILTEDNIEPTLKSFQIAIVDPSAAQQLDLSNVQVINMSSQVIKSNKLVKVHIVGSALLEQLSKYQPAATNVVIDYLTQEEKNKCIDDFAKQHGLSSNFLKKCVSGDYILKNNALQLANQLEVSLTQSWIKTLNLSSLLLKFKKTTVEQIVKELVDAKVFKSVFSALNKTMKQDLSHIFVLDKSDLEKLKKLNNKSVFVLQKELKIDLVEQLLLICNNEVNGNPFYTKARNTFLKKHTEYEGEQFVEYLQKILDHYAREEGELSLIKMLKGVFEGTESVMRILGAYHMAIVDPEALKLIDCTNVKLVWFSEKEAPEGAIKVGLE
ncbi:Conserved_hypothetical protein [Hexamita inflata]|uniref:Uncharacterized protein n=1 Tax=Hexamita inflata TaxID=28002 RepID=A0AA86UM28_9EUKA|nr:Conserved hypothetical protein [Hexamita inflata]